MKWWNQNPAASSRATLTTCPELAERFQEILAQIDKIKAACEALIERRTIILTYLDALPQTGDIATGFSGRLWNATVDVVTVMAEASLVFRFKDPLVIILGNPPPMAPCDWLWRTPGGSTRTA